MSYQLSAISGNNIVDSSILVCEDAAMAFSHVPTESRNQINKAGRLLVQDFFTATQITVKEFEWAWDLTNKWRACHAYPINTFQSTLRTKTRNLSGAIVAQRLKRMPTIIDKLRRYPSMTLAQMQDIAGIRAILFTVTQAEKLAEDYRKNDRFLHQLIGEKNYIQTPRDQDGYRSIHLIYRYKNNKNTEYDGLRLELQVRSKLQHIWATAVETMGTFLGQALKSREGDKGWLDFFAITSSAFAHMEKRPPVPRFKSLSQEQTFQAVIVAEKELNAVERMKAFSVAADKIVKTKESGRSQFYHLVILNSLKRTVQVRAYDRDSFNQALLDYSEVEAEAARGEKIEPVLVSAGPLETLRRAYPNFFLDITEFVKVVTDKILTPGVIP